jgi:hypothetical protein
VESFEKKTRVMSGKKEEFCGKLEAYLVSGDVGNRGVKVKMIMKVSGTVAVANTCA